MDLHIGDQIAVRDAAGHAGYIRRPYPLAQQKAQPGVAERVGRHLLRAIEPGIMGAVLYKLSDFLDPQAVSLGAAKDRPSSFRLRRDKRRKQPPPPPLAPEPPPPP